MILRHLRAAVLLATTTLSAEDAKWESVIYPKNQIFPSLLVTTATMDRDSDDLATWEGNILGDAFGVIGARLYDLKEGQKVRLEIESNDIFNLSSWEGTIPSTEEEWLIFPTLALRYNELIGNSQTRPLTLRLILNIDGERIGEITETATLRSINDCLFAVQEDPEDDSSITDFTWLFAGYVNEGHPWVDKVLRSALDLGIVNQFDGYQSGDPEAVLSQVYAIWRTMQEMGLKYSDVTATSVETDGVYSQHVRLFEDSINSRQANCVDGSVLLASVLRKIGLNTYLVLVPGHMFMAFDLDQDGENHLGLETTLMGATDLPALKQIESVTGESLSEHQNEESMATFLAALEAGTTVLEENADAFDDESDALHQYISISYARQNGILPIGFKEKK